MKYLNYVLVALSAMAISFSIYRLWVEPGDFILGVVSVVVMSGIMIYAIITMIENDRLEDELNEAHEANKHLANDVVELENNLNQCEIIVSNLKEQIDSKEVIVDGGNIDNK